jgi:threonine/homoserine/homoserine lactone efflux protein
MYEILFLSALVLSIFFCAMPGAVNTEALRRGLKGGFRPAFLVEAGSLIGDSTWAIIALIGLAFLVTNDVARIVIGVGGAALLTYLAIRAFLDAKNGIDLDSGEVKRGNDFATGALISLGNPFQVAFWLGIGGSAIAVLVPNPTAIDFAIFFFGYFAGGVIWTFLYSGLVAYGRRYVTPRLFQAINVICGAIMIYFALSLLWATFTA